MTLLDECIEALSPDVQVLPLSQRIEYIRLMTSNFPMALNGRIDWKKVAHKKNYASHRELFAELLEWINADVLIVWDGAHLPVLMSNLTKILENVDDVTAVGFDTWIYNPQKKIVIEFYHEGDITLGWL